jgi:pimeloyl-ACP methyl ester carboxylesterase
MLKPVRQAVERAVMSGDAILLGFCLGGAALALWLLVRFPEVGPRRLPSVVAAVLVVALVLTVSTPVFQAIAELGRPAVPLALLAVVLPSLTLAFWVSGCVLRALAELPGVRH